MENQLLFAWGANSYCQLGVGSNLTEYLVPQCVAINDVKSNIIKVIGGGGHSIVLLEDGDLYGAGWNSKGQLGLGHFEDMKEFKRIQLPGNDRIIDVACGWDFTCCLTDAGKVYTFGSNKFGQLGIPTHKSESSVPVCLPLSGCVNVSTGLRHAIAVLEKGTAKAWGDNSKGQCSELLMKVIDKPIDVSSIEDINYAVCGQNHSCLHLKSGLLVVFGCNKFGQLDKTADKKISPMRHGSNLKFSSICSGWTHIYGITKNSLVSWGRNCYAQLGRSSPESFDPVPRPIKLSNVTKVVSGAEHGLALLNNAVFAWGWNEHGNCGLGNTTNVAAPTLVTIPGKVKLIGAGYGTSFAVSLS